MRKLVSERQASAASLNELKKRFAFPASAVDISKCTSEGPKRFLSALSMTFGEVAVERLDSVRIFFASTKKPSNLMLYFIIKII